jgi:hypothetical protein
MTIKQHIEGKRARGKKNINVTKHMKNQKAFVAGAHLDKLREKEGRENRTGDDETLYGRAVVLNKLWGAGVKLHKLNNPEFRDLIEKASSLPWWKSWSYGPAGRCEKGDGQRSSNRQFLGDPLS